jgi:elongation factor G
MIELAAEHDEELLDSYIHDKPISSEMVHRAVRKGTLSNKLHPVFAGSALKYIGVQRLLDGVVGYLPSPLDKPVLAGHRPADKHAPSAVEGKKPVAVKCDPNGSLVALAFKVVGDVHGDLTFLRIYQGTLKSGTRVLNPNRDKRENITRIFQMHASERKILDSARAGDIVAALGLRQTLTGDTLCDPKNPVLLPTITFPHTVINMSIEPRTAAEREKLANALDALRREDPTFQCKMDKETGQTIISGMGELHLEVLQHKLVKEKKVNIRVGRPKVAYKEAITRAAQAEGKFIHQTGGHGQYGHVILAVKPMLTDDGHWAADTEFEAKVASDVVPRQYVSAVERGARQALGSGALAGYPVVGTKVTLIGGSFHSVDSSDLAFEQAAAIAVEKSLKIGGSVLLEPIMRLQVEVPEAAFGAVQGSILAKRGLITGCRVHGNLRVIDAKVPLVEMFGYSSEIRSLTAGRGTFTMEPLTYEKVPNEIAEQLVL